MKLTQMVEGLDEIIQSMKNLADRERNLEPFFQWLGEHSFAKAQERIEMGGIPPWEPTKYPSNLHPILRRTGELFDSLNPQNVQVHYSDGMATWSTDVPYAGFIQEGTINMPAREFIGFDSDDTSEAKDALRQYLLTGELPK